MKEVTIGLICLVIGIVAIIIGCSDVLHQYYAKVVSDGYCVYSNQVYRMEPVMGYEESL